MAIERNEKIIVGVNEFQAGTEQRPATLEIDEGTRMKQIRRLGEAKAARNQQRVEESLERLRKIAQTEENIIPSMLEAVESYATIGEISDILRTVWGEYEK